MANPTAAVPSRLTPWAQSEQNIVKLAGGTLSGAVSAAQWTYYPGEMIGMNSAGYHQKMDDTANLRFAGLVANSGRVYVDSADADGDNSIILSTPRYFTMQGSGFAVTDVGRRVYAQYSNQVNRAVNTYGNPVGRIVRYISSTEVQVEGHYYNRLNGIGHTYTGRIMLPATGAQTLDTSYLGKTIVCISTAGQTINLPALADVDVGEGFLFFKGSGGNFTVTLDGNAAETINGAATSATMTANYKFVEIVKMEVSAGSFEWSIIRSN